MCLYLPKALEKKWWTKAESNPCLLGVRGQVGSSPTNLGSSTYSKAVLAGTLQQFSEFSQTVKSVKLLKKKKKRHLHCTASLWEWNIKDSAECSNLEDAQQLLLMMTMKEKTAMNAAMFLSWPHFQAHLQGCFWLKPVFLLLFQRGKKKGDSYHGLVELQAGLHQLERGRPQGEEEIWAPGAQLLGPCLSRVS